MKMREEAFFCKWRWPKPIRLRGKNVHLPCQSKCGIHGSRPSRSLARSESDRRYKACIDGSPHITTVDTGLSATGGRVGEPSDWL